MELHSNQKSPIYNNQLQNIKFDTTTKSKNKGEISLNFTDGKTTTVAAKLIGKKMDVLPTTKMSSKKIYLSTTNANHELVHVEIKVKDLAKSLGISKHEMKTALRDGSVSQFLEPKEVKLQPKIDEKPEVAKKSKPILTKAEIREKNISQLPELGLSEKEFKSIEKFYKSGMENGIFANFDKPTFISRKISGEACSLVYVPDGPMKGLHVLLKTHGGVGEVGVGAFNRATLCLHLDSGEKKIFRNAKKEDVNDNEIKATKSAEKYSDHLVGGVVVEYEGAYRARKGRGKDFSEINKEDIPREQNVQKVGIILDYIEGGELIDHIESGLNKLQQTEIALKYAEAINIVATKFGKEGSVHLDQKPQNTFMTANGEPRVADFGYTVEKGTVMTGLFGTPGFMAPEYIEAELINNTKYVADPAADVWSMGCVFARMKTDEWFDFTVLDTNWDLDLTRIVNMSDQEIIGLKDQCFPERKIEGTLDHVIDQCLQRNPADRPSAEKVVKMLSVVRNNYLEIQKQQNVQNQII